MQVESLLKRALKLEFLSAEEGEFLFHNAATAELMFVANELNGEFPDNYTELLKLKGVGDYTASAIALTANKGSFVVNAFIIPTPVSIATVERANAF